ncbi:unnamed protein product [Acanthosepion pharaonis]|uniref:Uncharacterized protein n=1 Tax=Acanthosepion pharaonis TaxID=158019 RepID=A0A812C360_ACAPH|nr:unnamed protein product [Sepia pharaonis]
MRWRGFFSSPTPPPPFPTLHSSSHLFLPLFLFLFFFFFFFALSHHYLYITFSFYFSTLCCAHYAPLLSRQHFLYLFSGLSSDHYFSPASLTLSISSFLLPPIKYAAPFLLLSLPVSTSIFCYNYSLPLSLYLSTFQSFSITFSLSFATLSHSCIVHSLLQLSLYSCFEVLLFFSALSPISLSLFVSLSRDISVYFSTLSLSHHDHFP